MSENALTDAGVGRALFTTRLMLSLQAAKMCLWVGALPGMMIPFAIWFYTVTPHDLDMVKMDIMASVVSAVNLDAHRKWRARDESGRRGIVTVEKDNGDWVQWLTPGEIKWILKRQPQPVDRFHAVAWTGLAAAVLGYLAIWVGLKRMGSGNQQNKRIRGAKTLVTPKTLSTLVRHAGASPYRWVRVPLPATAPMMGMLAQGAQGTGKSLAIHDLMQQVFQQKKKCIIYDQSGEYFRAYYRPGKDFFFNPACLGSVPWSIFSELTYRYDADTLAQAFLPPKGGVVTGPSAFFEDAARALFSVILLRLAQRNARNTSDIAKAFFSMPDAEMELLIQNSVASSAVGGDSKAQRQGVISSIAIYLNGIASVKEGTWSIREFLDLPGDARFFILGTEDTKAMFAPLYRLLLTVSFDAIAAKNEIVHEDRYWYFLDEVATLGDIKLDDHLATKRKFGVSIVAGIQADNQLMTSMGKERGQTVMNCFNTLLVLRNNEPDAQERMARRLGKLDVDTVSRNQALAVTEWRDAAGLNKSEHEKWLVMPAELGGLANCTGYLKLQGEFPVATIDYRHWLPRRPGAACRADRFKGKHELPARDPDFIIRRADNPDALASVRDDLAQRKGDGAGKPADATNTEPPAMPLDHADPLAVPAEDSVTVRQEVVPAGRGIDSLSL